MRASSVFIAAAVAIGLAAPAFAQQAPPGTAAVMALAPADEYFGHFRLSILGIANALKLAADRLQAGADPHAICEGSLFYVNDAIAAWERAYPQDPAIPRELLALERTYSRTATAEGRAHALETENWLHRDYPNSAAAREAP